MLTFCGFEVCLHGWSDLSLLLTQDKTLIFLIFFLIPYDQKKVAAVVSYTF